MAEAIFIEIPRKERVIYRQVQLNLAGKAWSGRWHIEDGEVVVCSAYGYAQRAHGRRKPALVAEELMREILCGWCGLEVRA